jgi:hypothetical protein
VGITHLKQGEREQYEVGHIRGRWSDLGSAAGTVGVGVGRIEVADGGFSTPGVIARLERLDYWDGED